jgi:pyruvate ferredoxin oxidoreductase alpha subunit
MGRVRKGIEVSIAMADAVAQADVDVIAAYPITPQTHIVEHLADIVANGELDAEFVPVDSLP